jgi:hypothetical protein
MVVLKVSGPRRAAVCWSGAYNFARCCSGSGDASCWSGRYTSSFCCTSDGH